MQKYCFALRLFTKVGTAASLTAYHAYKQDQKKNCESDWKIIQKTCPRNSSYHSDSHVSKPLQ